MLINVDDIRKIRQIAKNIPDDRIEIYIREAESLDVIPYMGVELYEKLNTIPQGQLQKAGFTLESDPNALSLSDVPINEWKMLNGGTYKGCDGKMRQFGGFKKALSYLAYSRFVRAHTYSVTPFGVVNKMGDESTPVNNGTLMTLSAEAEKIGQEYLHQTMEYCNILNSSEGYEKKRKKFIAIGD